jgi:hypothetical protein
LRFRFQPGDRFYLVSVSEQTTTQVVDGNQQVASQTTRLGCDLDIDEVEENGCAWAKYTYRRVAMKITGSGVNVEFDSDANAALRSGGALRSTSQPKVPLQAQPLAVVVGEGFYVKITPQGRIDKINGLQSVVGSAKAKVPNMAGRNQVIQAIVSQFAEAAVKRELEDRLAVFPDLNSVTGDPCLVTPPSDGRGDEERVTTWSRTEQIDEEKIVVERTFRLKERRVSGDMPGVAVVDINIVIRPAADVDETVRSGVRIRREVSGQGAGQIEIDESTGRIMNERLTQDSAEEIKASSEGPVRRIPPIPEPTTKHIVKAFQMIKRDSEKPHASPTPGGAEGSQPNQP